jgi:hypothetical protein
MMTPEDAAAIWAELPELLYQALRDWLATRTGAGLVVPPSLLQLRQRMLFEAERGDPELASLLQRLAVVAAEFIDKGAYQIRLDRPDLDMALCAAIPGMEPVWLEGWEGDDSPETPLPGMDLVYFAIRDREQHPGE